ncbi:glycosyltransferase family 31 protein [Teratosphaeria destructans]|uniref:Glycosyltransferase family 31 protein n=1 Tax=Teratosphaeria destructans TaxID=418781 RepID=A0A9W7SY40_9PEZI|nr:glycosyltransferase family 31 protein [Teratosphaeria destructans]
MRTSSGRTIAAAVAFLVAVTLLLSWRSQHIQSSLSSLGNSILSKDLPCRSFPGANDTVVVLKTGTTEHRDKLPIHFKTNLRCYPNYMIVSDHTEEFQGHRVWDALEGVTDYVKDTHPDFEQYRRLREAGEKGLDVAEWSGASSHEVDQSERMQVPAWKLDKWKFLPMMNLTLTHHPDKKWYIFCEADTFFLWKTLLVWLSGLDPSEDMLLGASVNADHTQIAHGGSGFIITRSALQKVVELWSSNKEHWEDKTDNDEIGDGVLAQAFNKIGIFVSNAWPVLQGDRVGVVDYQPDVVPPKQLWCSPTVSYHHINPDAIETMWEFEQDWVARNGGWNNSNILHHYDIFRDYSLPRIESGVRTDWDNNCKISQGFVLGFDECHALCERDLQCLQFLLDEESECFSNEVFQLGASSSHATSGWIVDRVMQTYERPDSECDGWEWPLAAMPSSKNG